MPPSTTIAKMIADSMKVKEDGLIKPWRVAKKEPANPANTAPMPKADNLIRTGLSPKDRHAVSSSRNASHARPTGNRLMRTENRWVTKANAKMM